MAEILTNNSIRSIDTKSVHKICSGQVVLNLASSVKELVENSIDAGATNVEIRLKEYGSELIEVIDNGCGVKECDFKGLTLKHHTSKLQDFSDLTNIETFGFRGEALSSLCALSDLVITTCHEAAAIGTKLEYNHQGILVKKTCCPRQIGTTVSIQNLFSTLPVRHKEFHRNLRKEFAKMVNILTAYCLVSTNKRITCQNQTNKGRKTTVLSTPGAQSVKENIASVFGAKQLNSLVEFTQSTPLKSVLEEFYLSESDAEEKIFSLEGYISSCAHGEGRSSADRQFLFINGRPCDFNKVSRVINEVYHTFNRHQYPFVFLNISLEKDAIDVNVTPDKRQIFVQKEKFLLATVKSSLLQIFECQPSVLDNNSYGIIKEQKQASILSFGKPITSYSEGVMESPQLLNLKRSFATHLEEDYSAIHLAKSQRFDNLQNYIDLDKQNSSMITSDISFIENENTGCVKDPQGNLQVCKDNSYEQLSSLCELTKLNVTSIFNQEMKYDKDTNGTNTFMPPQNTVLVSSEKLEDVELSEPGTSSTSWVSHSPKSSGKHVTPRNSPLKGNNINSSWHKKIAKSGITGEVNFSLTVPFKEEKAIGTVLKKDSKSLQSNPLKELLKFSRTSKNITLPLKEVSSQKKLAYMPDISLNENKFHQSNTDESEETRPETEEASIGMTNASFENIIVDEPVEQQKKTVCVDFSLESLRQKLLDKANHNASVNSIGYRKFRAKIAPSESHTAEDELKKELRKEMFPEMEIVGQFNLGFIIAKLNSDLFIIDQHASDEKYNFETLQKETVLETQKLLYPQLLELTVAAESILLDNIQIFEKNGFKFNVSEDGQPGRRVQLISAPVSKNWSFGKEDIDELIFMLTDNSGRMCRPSRVCQMFASRACRKSVMIGTALSPKDMKKLVCHMGELEQPWNCPHGRPTIRHLFDLNMLQST